MFWLEQIKQQKLKERPKVVQQLHVCDERKRPVYSLRCDSSCNIIAEIKKASPTYGILKKVDPGIQAALYQDAGAKAVSVLTDNSYFGGSFDDLHTVTQTVTLPVLCKEFICCKEQIDLAYTLGADIILLIATMLSTHELEQLYAYTLKKGLLPLIEVHTLTELERVLHLQPEYLMVNVRNLSTLELEYDIAIATLQEIPHPVKKICASGIDSPDTLQRIKEHTGTTTFLVGTALMKSDNPCKLLKELSHVC